MPDTHCAKCFRLLHIVLICQTFPIIYQARSYEGLFFFSFPIFFPYTSLAFDIWGSQDIKKEQKLFWLFSFSFLFFVILFLFFFFSLFLFKLKRMENNLSCMSKGVLC